MQVGYSPHPVTVHNKGNMGDILKSGVPFMGVPIIRIILFWGLYWDPPILGNPHIKGYIIIV